MALYRQHAATHCKTVVYYYYYCYYAQGKQSDKVEEGRANTRVSLPFYLSLSPSLSSLAISRTVRFITLLLCYTFTCVTKALLVRGDFLAHLPSSSLLSVGFIPSPALCSYLIPLSQQDSVVRYG